jgi:predicted nucleic acid-binding protein
VKAAIDTSILVAAHLATHPHHAAASEWMAALTSGRVNGVVTVHALAEVWSVLTKLPIVPRIQPASARKVVTEMLSDVQVVSLSQALYLEALDRCVSRGVVSGAVFDALHLVAAEQAGADVMLTFNEKDFVRLAEPGTPRILSPQSRDAEALLASIASWSASQET